MMRTRIPNRFALDGAAPRRLLATLESFLAFRPILIA